MKHQVSVLKTRSGFLNDYVSQKLDYLHVSLKYDDRIARSDKYNDKSILEVVHNTIQGKIPLVGVGGIRNREDVEQVLKYAELAEKMLKEGSKKR